MAIIGLGLGTSNAAVAVLGGVAVPFARFSGTPTCGSFLSQKAPSRGAWDRGDGVRRAGRR